MLKVIKTIDDQVTDRDKLQFLGSLDAIFELLLYSVHVAWLRRLFLVQHWQDILENGQETAQLSTAHYGQYRAHGPKLRNLDRYLPVDRDADNEMSVQCD